MSPRRDGGLMPLDEAQQLMLHECLALEPVASSPLEAIGMVAASTVRSPMSVPSFVNSAMDGYALSSSDCARPGARLRVTGVTMAGSAAPGPVSAGEAVRIMTGAPVPEGADAVCPVELVDVQGDSVLVNVAVLPGQHLRYPGEDVERGDTVLESGALIEPVDAGLLCAVGVEEVSVVRRPRVGVLSTGDELLRVASGRLPGEGMIHDANRTTLLGMVADGGFHAVDLGVVGDDENELISVLVEASGQCDAIVTTGGVSVGDRDIVRGCLSRLPTRVAHALQVAIKPGKPQVFAVLMDSGTVLFGLPGNPVSAAVSFELFVRPGLRSMAGHHELFRPRITAEAVDGLQRKPDGRFHMVPVTLFAGSPVQVRSSGRQGSHVLSSLQGADALALLPDGLGAAPGDPVTCLLLHPERGLPAASGPAFHGLASGEYGSTPVIGG